MASHDKIKAVATVLYALGGKTNKALASILYDAADNIGHEIADAVNTEVAKYSTWTPAVTYDEIQTAKLQGKIPAIKAIRSRTNAGLKQSKDAIELAVRPEEFYKHPEIARY